MHVLTGNKGSCGKRKNTCHYAFAQSLGFLFIWFLGVYSGVLFREASSVFLVPFLGKQTRSPEPRGAVGKGDRGACWGSGPLN